MTSTPEKRIEQLGFGLPQAPKPIASYVPARKSGHHVFISGQVPLVEGKIMAEGTVPSHTSPETASDCARQCTLNALACLKNSIGELSRVTKVVRAGVFVSSDPGFGGQPLVANGCSDLLIEVFGQEIGEHARAAVGVISLPRNVPVEIEFIFEVE